jgi:CRP-like cAMP-binding protein
MESDDLHLFHKTLKTVSKLSDESFDTLSDIVGFRSLKKKEFLIREGEVCRDLYFINKGMIRTYLIHEGIEVTTWVALAGNFDTSAHSFLKSTPSLTNLQAITDCELIVISKDAYDKALATLPEGRGMAMSILQDYYINLENMFYSCLSLPATERYTKLGELFPEHFRCVPQKYLASMIRVKEATLSRLRKRLSRPGHSND